MAADQVLDALVPLASNGGVAVALIIVHRMLASASSQAMEITTSGYVTRIETLEASNKSLTDDVDDLRRRLAEKDENEAAHRAWRHTMEASVRHLLMAEGAAGLDPAAVDIVEAAMAGGA